MTSVPREKVPDPFDRIIAATALHLVEVVPRVGAALAGLDPGDRRLMQAAGPTELLLGQPLPSRMRATLARDRLSRGRSLPAVAR